jgi:glutamate/tyrosine decarboxylase-like PLP-dependent enzyme
MSISGHKWWGMPWSCGVYVTKKNLLYTPTKDFASYAGDWKLGPFGCTRNAVTFLLMHSFIARNSLEKQ